MGLRASYEIFYNDTTPGYEVIWEHLNGGRFVVYYLGKEVDSFEYGKKRQDLSHAVRVVMDFFKKLELSLSD